MPHTIKPATPPRLAVAHGYLVVTRAPDGVGLDAQVLAKIEPGDGIGAAARAWADAANPLPALQEQNRRLVEALRYLVAPPQLRPEQITPEHVDRVLHATDNARNLLRELGGE